VTREDADMCNPGLARLAIEKVNVQEKKLKVLKERKGNKIVLAVWQNVSFHQAVKPPWGKI
jgi:hypothetical protein